MKKTIFSILISASFGLSAHAADCGQISKSVKSQVSSDKSKVLEVVSATVSASPDCSCEIVKAAILASHASAQTVGKIVDAAANAAPSQVNVISECATAVAPDAHNEVQAVVSRLTGFSGAEAPLDSPGQKGVFAAHGNEVWFSRLTFIKAPSSLMTSRVVTNPNP